MVCASQHNVRIKDDFIIEEKSIIIFSVLSDHIIIPKMRNKESSKIVGKPFFNYSHRLSIIRPSKPREEKSPSDGHCQCQKEIDDHLLACQLFLTESHIVTRLAKERASLLNMNDINDI
jgi:hypothetical protein